MKNLTDEQKAKLKKWADFALYAQDACNLCAVAQTFAQATSEIMHIACDIDAGTDWVNTHPIVVMFASKFESLSHCDDSLVFSKAYDACKKLAGKE